MVSNGGATITKTVGRSEMLAHGKLGTFGDLFVAPDTTLAPGVTIFADAPEWTTVEPLASQTLSVGEHTINVYWTLAKQHCDGFTSNLAASCLPAGESLSRARPLPFWRHSVTTASMAEASEVVGEGVRVEDAHVTYGRSCLIRHELSPRLSPQRG